MIRLSAGHGLKLSVSANSPHPRTVHVHNHVPRQSVSTDWQRIQLSMNRQWQRSWIVRSQSAVVDSPRTRIGHGHGLSAVADRQRIVPVPASPRPHRRRPVSRSTFNPFRSMTTFDPAEVRKAVVEVPSRGIFGRRDQRADCSAALHKPRARHELAFSGQQQECGLPSALGGGHCAPLADHRPKPDNSHKRKSDKFVNQ
jgi:hypothetical protein